MAEPISSSAAAAVSSAAALGVTAALAEAHFSPYMLMLTFAGAVIGAGLAKPGKSKVYDAAVFVSVGLGSAQLGRSFAPMLARHMPDISEPGMALAFAVAVLFHPGFNLLVDALPRFLERFGIKGAQS